MAMPKSPGPRTRHARAPEQGDVYLGGAASGDLLVAELASFSRKGLEVADGVVVVEAAGGVVDRAFARTVLPRARMIAGAAGANDLAAAALDVAAAAGASLEPDDVILVVPDVARRGSNKLDESPLAAARV